MLLQKFATEDFLELLKQKNSGAIEDLVRAYTTLFFRTAMGMGLNEDRAYELVQITWVTFFEKIDSFEGRSHVKTYLMGILYNKVREHRRKEQRYFLDEKIDEIIESGFDQTGHWKKAPLSPQRFMEIAQTGVALEECLQALPDKQRMVFVLREVEGEPSEEICKILDITDTHLGVLMYRAKNKLRLCLQVKEEVPGGD